MFGVEMKIRYTNIFIYDQIFFYKDLLQRHDTISGICFVNKKAWPFSFAQFRQQILLSSFVLFIQGR